MQLEVYWYENSVCMIHTYMNRCQIDINISQSSLLKGLRSNDCPVVVHTPSVQILVSITISNKRSHVALNQRSADYKALDREAIWRYFTLEGTDTLTHWEEKGLEESGQLSKTSWAVTAIVQGRDEGEQTLGWLWVVADGMKNGSAR